MRLTWTPFGRILDQMQTTRQQLHEQLRAMGSDGRYSAAYQQERAAVLHQTALADTDAQLDRFGAEVRRLVAPAPTDWTAAEWAARTYHRQEWTKRLNGVNYDRAMELLEQAASD